ncbi:hypothetical protein PT974_07630 [Cladobotryum mycophilum]|uniref:Rhodopsin domain-containing protein n=1 Tax=Cladobotryum mycophilum TaxID=491253 RepID=A0ABR0SQK1_9HYPO
MSSPTATLAPPGMTADMIPPSTSLQTVNYVVQALTIFFVSIFVAARIYAKHKVLGGGVTMDDYATYMSFILFMGYCGSSISAGLNGGGIDQRYVPPEQIQRFFQSSYAATLFYAPTAMAIKLALLIIIIRVFGSVHKKTLIGVYTLIIIIILYYVSGFFIKVFVCTPISEYWKGHLEHCLDQRAIITADAIISVLSDTVILLLPTPLTWSLQLPRRKRLRVTGLLCAGGIATAFGIYRLALIIREGNSPNQTYVFTKVILSGNAEVGIGLICACLPAVNALWTEQAKGSSYFKQSGSTSGDAQRGEIMLTRSFHVDTLTVDKELQDTVIDLGHDEEGLVSDIRAAPPSSHQSIHGSESTF